MSARLLLAGLAAAAALVPASGCRRRPPPPPPASADSTNASFVELDTLALDDYSSRVRWSGVGFTDVRFSKLRGEAVLRGDSLAGLTITLDAASLVQMSANRSEGDPAGPTFLDAARFPEVVFRLERVRVDTTGGSTSALLDGQLSLLGQTRPLSVPASLRITSTPIGTEVRRSLAIDASFVLPSADWDSTGAHRTGPISVRANLIGRPRDAPLPGSSIRASQRFQDSVRSTPGGVSDSAALD